ncbi:MAG TPA: protein kinase [Polyangiaceae bacterium]|nr:protein kinase [Polyangiaceae bacterium]
MLGEGAVGTVYEVWDEVRSERLALKTLHKFAERRATPGAVRGFKQEFRNVASVSHENLVVLHELFFEDELWFFTMELVRGKPFSSTRGPAPAARMPADTLRDRFAQLARGINALHQVDVVHRDIKPQNVMVEAGGRVVLLDFGMVTPLRAGSHQTAYGGFAGSPGYVAPEQVFGESLTFASDWYSFGCVLYEALTGLLPFEDGREAILMRKLSHAPTPPSQLVPGVPDDLEQLCLGLLERKPERRPDAREVLCSLGEAGPISRPSVVPSSRQQARVFVGRELERRAIGAWLRSGGGRRPRVTVLSGPSGIGKTTLAEAVIGDLRGRDALVLRSRCLKQEVVPFNAWDSLIDELSGLLESPEPPRAALRMDPALPRLFPVLARGHEGVHDAAMSLADPIEIRSEGVRALRELFLELGSERPVLLFIDDIQWADADSVRLLRELVLGSGAPPLEVLVTLRPGSGESTRIEALLAEPELEGLCRKFAIGPLPHAESIALIDSLARLGGAARDAVLTEAEGNPFLIAELARDAEQLGDPARILLTEVLAERLGKLTPQARTLFEVIAVLGRPLPFHVALGAAGISGQALEDLHRLRALGLIRWSGLESEEEVEVYHDRWRAALDARLGSARRRECFSALAESYARRARDAEDAEVLAHCYQECGEPELAARHALTAARTAEAALAFERAANAYGVALELGSWQSEERIELFTRLGEMANAAGRGTLAGRAFADAAALVDAPRQLDLQRRAAQAFMSSGHQHEGERILLDVLRAVGRPLPTNRAAAIGVYALERWKLRRRGLQRKPRPLSPRTRQRVEAADVAAAVWMNHDPVASWTYAMRELRWLLDADDDRLLLRALSRELVFAATEPLRGDWIAALTELGDELASRVVDPAVVALYRSAQALRTFLAGDWSKATREAREAEQMLRTRCAGVHWELAWVRRMYVAAIQIEGDMLAAEPLIQAWLEDAEQRDDREGIVTHLLGLGYCHLCRDEPAAITQLARRLSTLIGSAHSGSFNIAWIEGFTLCYEGAEPAALEQVLQRIRGVHRTEHGRVLLYRVWSRGYESRLLAALAVATAGRERSRWLGELRRLERQLASENWSYATSVAKNIEASLAWFAGDRVRAARALDESARISTRTGARLFAAVARLASARALGDGVAEERASAALRALNVADVERMARAHLPAFWAKGVGG